MMRINMFSWMIKTVSFAQRIEDVSLRIFQATRNHAMTLAAWFTQKNSEGNRAIHVLDLIPGNRTTFMQVAFGYLTVALGMSAVCALASSMLFAGEKSDQNAKTVTIAQESGESPISPEIQTVRELNSNPPETVHEADRLLSHPDDPMRKAAGVAMSKINFTRALPEVLKALQKYQDSPRFTYQLGRAYEAAGDLEQALEAYHKAAKLGYPMAFYNLALHYQDGKAVAADSEKSKEYCQIAVAAGIEPAEELLRHYEFDAAGFSDPKLFQSLYAKTLDLSKQDHEELAATLQPFLETFFQTKDIPQPVSRSAYMRVSKIMTQQALKNVFVPRVTPGRTRNVTFGMVDKLRLGRQDAQLFYDRYGCESEVARQFFTNVEYYIQRLE